MASAVATSASATFSLAGHSITSSARAISVGGTSRPRAFAVLRLITSSYLVGGLHRQVCRLFAPQDAINVPGRAPKIIEQVISVGQQPAAFSEEVERIDGRKTVASSKRYDVRAMDVHEGIRHHQKAAIRLAGMCGNDGFEPGRVANRRCDRLRCEGGGGGFEGGLGNIPHRAWLPG
jgi:hypothetical protein